jgi:PAS domain S-box-containing protein
MTTSPTTLDVERLCRDLVREAPDAIVLADAGGAIRLWNRGAERIFGFSAAEALGRSLDIIIPEKQRERHWSGYRSVMETGRSRYADGELLAVPAIRKDGSRLSIEFTIVPIAGADGALIGLGAILRDVTRRFEEMKSLRAQLAARQRATPADPA